MNDLVSFKCGCGTMLRADLWTPLRRSPQHNLGRSRTVSAPEARLRDAGRNRQQGQKTRAGTVLSSYPVILLSSGSRLPVPQI